MRILEGDLTEEVDNGSSALDYEGRNPKSGIDPLRGMKHTNTLSINIAFYWLECKFEG